jgi:hypothetical protein
MLGEFSAFGQVFERTVAFHFCFEASAHFKKDQACCVDVNFFCSLLRLHPLSLFLFVVLLVGADQTFLFWTQVH